KESVSTAKVLVENLLAGHVASDNFGPISAPYLFHTTSDAFLEHVKTDLGVTVIRDLQRTVLRLYGTKLGVIAAQDAIIGKLEEMKSETHAIILDSVTLGPALSGGFRLIVASLGKDNVKIDITS
ncbi:hypothetical protein K491DRAFT_564149, partial [Lophiostoma macrostomum CBS 122681]